MASHSSLALRAHMGLSDDALDNTMSSSSSSSSQQLLTLADSAHQFWNVITSAQQQQQQQGVHTDIQATHAVVDDAIEFIHDAIHQACRPLSPVVSVASDAASTSSSESDVELDEADEDAVEYTEVDAAARFSPRMVTDEVKVHRTTRFHHLVRQVVERLAEEDEAEPHPQLSPPTAPTSTAAVSSILPSYPAARRRLRKLVLPGVEVDEAAARVPSLRDMMATQSRSYSSSVSPPDRVWAAPAKSSALQPATVEVVKAALKTALTRIKFGVQARLDAIWDLLRLPGDEVSQALYNRTFEAIYTWLAASRRYAAPTVPAVVVGVAHIEKQAFQDDVFAVASTCPCVRCMCIVPQRFVSDKCISADGSFEQFLDELAAVLRRCFAIMSETTTASLSMTRDRFQQALDREAETHTQEHMLSKLLEGLERAATSTAAPQDSPDVGGPSPRRPSEPSPRSPRSMPLFRTASFVERAPSSQQAWWLAQLDTFGTWQSTLDAVRNRTLRADGELLHHLMPSYTPVLASQSQLLSTPFKQARLVPLLVRATRRASDPVQVTQAVPTPATPAPAPTTERRKSLKPVAQKSARVVLATQHVSYRRIPGTEQSGVVRRSKRFSI